MRDRIVEQGDDAINDAMVLHIQKWIANAYVNFARQAKKEKEANKPPKASREIFQVLKEHNDASIL